MAQKVGRKEGKSQIKKDVRKAIVIGGAGLSGRFDVVPDYCAALTTAQPLVVLDPDPDQTLPTDVKCLSTAAHLIGLGSAGKDQNWPTRIHERDAAPKEGG